MKEAGISPDAITYRSLIARDTKRNLSSESMDLLEDMRQQGIRLNIGSYNSMMHDINLECRIMPIWFFGNF